MTISAKASRSATSQSRLTKRFRSTVSVSSTSKTSRRQTSGTQLSNSFLNSRSEDQLKGMSCETNILKEACSPAYKNGEMVEPGQDLYSITGVKLDLSKVSRPCGLFAKYFPKGLYYLLR